MAQLPATRTNNGGKASRRVHPLERLQHDFDLLFGRLANGWLTPIDQDPEVLRLWDLNVTDNDKEVVVRAEVPGFEQNEIEMQLNQDVLTIKAEKEQKSGSREEYRSFFRSVTLPPGTRSEATKATYRNGVLEVHIPKAESAQPRRIEIQSDSSSSSGQQGKQQSPLNAEGIASTQRGQSQTAHSSAAATGQKADRK